jgi:hypothetical protein
MDYKNTVYSITPNQNFHPFSLFKNIHSEELNFPTLLYGQPWQIFKGFSYQQIAQWELLHKSRDFSTDISNLFF